MISIHRFYSMHIALLFACFILPLNMYADKCGTFSDPFKSRQQAISKGDRILAPVLPYFILSPKKHFKIHYSKLGEGAIDSKDNNNNAIPDFVEDAAAAFEYAYTIEVDSMGFPPPPNNGENGAAPYDVYIIEFATRGFYGLTTPYEALPNSTSKHAYSLTYIEIDNNFSPDDKNGSGNQSFNTFGMDALKITAVHEFHHAIQFANYGINDQLYDVSFYELFSTWLEFHVFPDIKDYHFYVRDFFLEPKLNRFGQRYAQEISTGYANALFLEYLHDRVGIAPLINTWQEIGRKTYAYHALEMALENNSTPLHELWCGYQDRVFLTGKRAYNKDISETFRDAKFFPELKGKIDSVYTQGLFTGSVYPYEISLNSCILRSEFSEIADTAHIVISMAYKDSFKSIGSQDLGYTIIIDRDANKTPIGFSGYYADINTNSMPACALIHLSNGKYSFPGSGIYPNPLILHDHKAIHFPVPILSLAGETVELKIFTPSGMPVTSKQLPVIIDYSNSSSVYNLLMVKLDEILDFKPGVYIFTVANPLHSMTVSGKFTVKP
ncbi:MAG: MXAN_6640 family putative metalloprotease [Bacteroidota bacterium]